MARMLRMNSRYIAEFSQQYIAPSILEQTLLLMGFAAVTNLLKVSEALAQRDVRLLEAAAERNGKLARLRDEICGEIEAEQAKRASDGAAAHKLSLMADLAEGFEKMGGHTVDLAELCRSVVCNPTPSRVTEIKKLMEHGAQIADSTGAALVYEQSSWVKGAVEEGRAASRLREQIRRELDLLRRGKPDAAPRAEILGEVVLGADQIVEEILGLAVKVVQFLEEIHVRV